MGQHQRVGMSRKMRQKKKRVCRETQANVEREMYTYTKSTRK